MHDDHISTDRSVYFLLWLVMAHHDFKVNFVSSFFSEDLSAVFENPEAC